MAARATRFPREAGFSNVTDDFACNDERPQLYVAILAIALPVCIATTFVALSIRLLRSTRRLKLWGCRDMP